LTGTVHLSEVDAGVISSGEPLEPPSTSITKLDWELFTFRDGTDSTITISPAISRCAPLRRASIEETHTTTGNQNVEMVLPKISSSVGDLYNHPLPVDGPTREGEFITGTAPVLLLLPSKMSSHEAVAHVALGPGLIVGAGVGRSIVADTLLIHTHACNSVSSAAEHGSGHGSLSVPPTGWLATVPVAGRSSRTGLSICPNGNKDG